MHEWKGDGMFVLSKLIAWVSVDLCMQTALSKHLPVFGTGETVAS